MKISSIATRVFTGLACAALLSITTAYGQNNQSWDGASGTWDVGNTPEWNGANTWTNGNVADFGNGSGTVSVSDQGGTAPVDFNQIYFNNGSGSGYTFTGSSLTSGENSTPVYVDSGNTADETFTNQININEDDHNNNGDQSNISNNSATTLTLGAINVENTLGYAPNIQYLSINQAAGGKIVLNGPITTTGTTSTALLLGINNPSSVAGTYQINGSIQNGIQINTFYSQTLLLGTSNLGNQSINIIGSDYANPTSILTVGAQTITNNIQNQNDKADIFGGSTADISNFNGTLSPYATVTLVAATGGRVNFNGTINNQIGLGLGTSGNGTIALNAAGGNSYGLSYAFNPSPYSQGNVAANLGAAMTLINNGSGTAFGNNATATVNLLAHAGLGGIGTSTQQVIAADTSSVITAGDPGQASLGIAPMIGQLNLLGGLVATNGLTLDFKLTGADSPAYGSDNDYINLGSSGDFTLGGSVVVNFTTLDTVETDSPYILMNGGGNWTDPGTTFSGTAPAGYELNASYGTEGYFFDTSTDQFSVEFVAVPEPSTYAMLLVGLGALVLLARRKRA